MSLVIPLDKETVNIEDISISVVAPCCGYEYNIKLQGPSFMKNCRCSQGTFYVEVKSPTFGKSRIVVKVEHQTGYEQKKKVNPTGYSIERNL